jgi:hypothetical protein
MAAFGKPLWVTEVSACNGSYVNPHMLPKAFSVLPDWLRRVRCDHILLQRSRNYGVHEAGHERHGRSGEQRREVFLVRRVSQHGVWVSFNTYLPPFTS